MAEPALKDGPQIPTGWRAGICVFCGSSTGTRPEYTEAAQQLGRALAKADAPLVYGGGTNGLMGTVASSTILAGGRVWGIVPRAMIPFGERPGDSTTETKSSGPAFEDAAFAAKALKSGVPDQLARPTWVDAQGRPVTNGNSKQEGEGEGEQKSFATAVESMHERKLVMSRLAERGFFALPGGYGTFEELMEMVTWTQLGIHRKPVVVLNVLGLFTPLQQLVVNAVQAGFIPPANAAFLVFVDPPPPSASGEETAGWDWGEKAIQALEEWYAAKGGMGGGRSYSLDWKDS